MTKEARLSIGLTLAVTLCGVGTSYGVVKTQTEHNKQEIESVRAENEKIIAAFKSECDKRFDSQDRRINEQSVILQSINNSVTSMNTKIDLIVEGKLKMGKNE